MKELKHPLDKKIPTELRELVDSIGDLPEVHSKLAGPLAKAIAVLTRKRKILDLVQDALIQLRLDMKYLLFDLESTRRERDEYKRQLEEK
jgi:hypothetical protein